jgi:hypothetical protein
VNQDVEDLKVEGQEERKRGGEAMAAFALPDGSAPFTRGGGAAG